MGLLSQCTKHGPHGQTELGSIIASTIPYRVPTPGNLRIQRAVRRLNALIYRIIAERRASGTDPGDLLSMLLQMHDEDDGSEMNDRQLRDELMTMFGAGHETTAVVLSWAWYLLAQHPEAERKLVDELVTVLGGRVPGVEDLPRLRYAEMVIQESLRLYPPAWAISREARQDTRVGGFPAPAGANALIAPWVLHRDPRFFDRPDEFEPERWVDGMAQPCSVSAGSRLTHRRFTEGPQKPAKRNFFTGFAADLFGIGRPLLS